MNLQSDFLTLFMVLMFAGVLIYRISYLRRTWIGYFSLLQIVYLIVIPGFLVPMILAYLQSIVARPLNAISVLPDRFLYTMTLLSLFFTYGGVAIHSVTKMLADEGLRYKKGAAADMNRFFHLTFSHNLIFGGGLLCFLGLVLLEMNHAPVNAYDGWWSIFKGITIGILFIISMFFYTRSHDQYSGKWGDLKIFFILLWLVFITLLYGIRKADTRMGDYEMLLPALLTFSLMAFLNIVLVFQRLKRGGFRVAFSHKRFKRLLEP